MINIKLRPRKAPKDAVIYVWGAVVATGSFIVDLDNPWSLTGYNLTAMSFYRPILKYILNSSRCTEIRCISQACRLSLKALFGQAVYDKSSLHYPCIPQKVSSVGSAITDDCRFLFVGTQFEKKDEEFEEIPDFDSQLSNYEVLSWDLNPGDCIAFNFLTVHGAPGNSSKISRRRAFAARFTGDDVRYIRRKGEMSPPFPDLQLEEGQPIDCATFPQILKR